MWVTVWATGQAFALKAFQTKEQAKEYAKKRRAEGKETAVRDLKFGKAIRIRY